MGTGEAEKLISNVTETLSPKTLRSNRVISDDTLTENDKKKIKEGVQKEVSKLPKEKPVKTIGFTESQLLEIKEKVKELQIQQQKNVQTMGITSVLMKGAYDNYYNYDRSTGSFVVQGLSAFGHKYIKYSGSTIGSTKNSNSMTSYMNKINSYEDAIVAGMAGPNAWEIVSWITVMASLTTFTVGMAVGPAGWLASTLITVDGLVLLTSYTSASFTTVTRLEKTREAMTHLENARTMLFNEGAYWENHSANYSVSGY